MDERFSGVAGPELLAEFAGDHQEVWSGLAAVFQPVEAEIDGLLQVTFPARHEAEGDPAFGDAHRAEFGTVACEVLADDGSPALLARLREIDEQREAAIADTLAAETGATADDITLAVAAAQLAAVHRVLFRQALRMTLEGKTRAETIEELSTTARQAFEQLEPSLGSYAIR